MKHCIIPDSKFRTVSPAARFDDKSWELGSSRDLALPSGAIIIYSFAMRVTISPQLSFILSVLACGKT